MAVSPRMTTCNLCGHAYAKEVDYPLAQGGIVSAMRCLKCDTLECHKCRGRNIEPSAERCKHCNADIRLRPKGLFG